MIEFRQVTKIYNVGSELVHALAGVSLTINTGEFVAIMGASGSGKSTMMSIIGCLDRPTEGEYLLNGKAVQKLTEDELAGVRNKELGFVFQQFNLLPRMTTIDNVTLPLIYAHADHHERVKLAERALEQVGLKDRMHHRPNQLSGGQQQRVSIARALVNNPKILLADEPTGALDSHTSSEIMSLLTDLHTQGRTVILVTHDAEVASYAKRQIRLKDGLIVSDTGAN